MAALTSRARDKPRLAPRVGPLRDMDGCEPVTRLRQTLARSRGREGACRYPGAGGDSQDLTCCLYWRWLVEGDTNENSEGDGAASQDAFALLGAGASFSFLRTHASTAS